MLEKQMPELRDLPARVTGLESQILQLRGEMREGLSAIRSELLTEIRTGNQDGRNFMRALFEEAPTRAVYRTNPAKCHVSHVVADTGSWEQKLAESLEEMPEVACYVKNHGLNFTIPYTLNGEDRADAVGACR